MKKHSEITRLYNKFNKELFNSVLPHSSTHKFEIGFSGRMTRAYGYCGWKKNRQDGEVTMRYIKLAKKIVEFDANGQALPRMIQTLLHEMCHLSMDVTGNSDAAHGPKWRREWIRIASKFDEMYDHDYTISEYAVEQVTGQYANCRTSTKRASGPKYTLTCDCCDFRYNTSRYTRKISAAINGLVGHGSHG